jgi:hypothetical protein
VFSRTNDRNNCSVRDLRLLAPVALLALVGAGPAGAQTLNSAFISGTTCPMQAQVVEWDLPDGGTDFQPGAIFVDVRGSHESGHPIWFVTRIGIPGDDHKVYRLEPRNKRQSAPFTSWTLNADGITTGGLRRVHASRDGGLVAVRMLRFLQLISTGKCVNQADGTTTCRRFNFLDDPGSLGVSDVAIDDYHNVFTTATSPASDLSEPDVSYVQRLRGGAITTVQPGVVSVKVTRWFVGGGAGVCKLNDQATDCIAGVATKRGDSTLVYFSAPADNVIGELNTATNTVRRFPLAAVGARDPRQIDVDNEGVVWAVAGSGHLVRIDPNKRLSGCSSYCAAMSSHAVPESTLQDPFGVTIDRGGRRGRNDNDQFRNEFVGYTAPGTSEVGLLLPNGKLVSVPAPPSPAPPDEDVITGTEEQSLKNTGAADPMAKKVTVTVADKADGTFLEAQIAEGGSFAPLGITPDHRGRFGTFYYAVGEPMDPSALKRIERVTFPRVPRRPDNPRDNDDHDDDGVRDDKDADKDDDGVPNGMDNDDDNDCVPNDMDDDDDGDHLEDKHDRADRREEKWTEWGPAAAGSSNSYTVTTTSSTTLLTIVATASDLTAPISLEILTPAGIAVSTGLPTPGTAVATFVPLTVGNHTVRVKNHGLSTVNVETLLITQNLPLF